MKYLHRVVQSDTLESIAGRYGVGIREVLELNKIDRDNIREGLILSINKINGARYVVKPFDDINNVARIYGVSVEDIRQFNEIENIFVGQIIYIPYR